MFSNEKFNLFVNRGNKPIDLIQIEYIVPKHVKNRQPYVITLFLWCSSIVDEKSEHSLFISLYYGSKYGTIFPSGEVIEG